MYKYIFLMILALTTMLQAEYIDFEQNANKAMVNYNSNSLNEIEIKFNLKGYEHEIKNVNGLEYSQITIPQEGSTMATEKPELPSVTRLFAIPAVGEVSFQINSSQEITQTEQLIYPRQTLKTESSRAELPFVKDEAFYREAGLYPESSVIIGEPVIMRDIRMVPVTFNPFRFNAANQELRITTNLEITLNVSRSGGTNIKAGERKFSRAFENIYRSTVINYEQFSTRDLEFQVPSYLFIYPNDTQVETYLQELINWKHEKGFSVTAVSLAETGSSQISVLNYIQDAYDSWEDAPEYVCLVGDAAGVYEVPTGHYVDPPYNGEGDHVYAMLEGDDILADVIIGRLSFNTLNEFQTILSKILNYEKNPYLGNTDWFNQAVLVGDPTDSGQSCVDTKLFIRDMMSDFVPDFDYYEIYSGNWASEMANGLNNGAAYFNYRGFVGMSGWTVNSINDLNNGYMLPLAVSLTCLTGDFEGVTDCISERFLKAGTPTVPRGAIAAISTATGNTHTCFNNLVDAAIFEGIFADQIYNPGGALVKGKLVLYQTYPENPFDHVVKFSYWNNLMGDPGLDLWTAVPQEINLSCETEIALGTNNLAVEVTDSNGDPLEGVWVTVLQGEDEIFTSAYTDEAGEVLLEINAETVGTAKITATKHNFIPEQLDLSIIETAAFINIANYQIDDDLTGDSQGNNDGLLNPGETIELVVELMNYGNSPVSDVSAQLQISDEFVTIISDQISLGQLNGSSSATGTFLLEISPNATGNLEFGFDLLIEAGSGNSWNDLIYLTSYGPVLEVLNTEIDNAEGIIAPGETADLMLNVANIGTAGLADVFAVISTNDNRVIINDNLGEFGYIASGEEVTNTQDVYNISVDNSIVPGSMITFEIEFYNASGYQQFSNFSLQVGEVSVNDPLGPDEYGHYIYDSGDLQYVNTMFYDWIEIDPQYGGQGTVITTLVDPGNMGTSAEVQLPFTMVFYGNEYNTLTICSNGWIAPGSVDMDSFMNWSLPGPLGPSPMIAVFWDDLKLGDMEPNGYIPNGGLVCYYYDEAQDYFIVEWSNLRNEFNNDLETFQAIIYDPFVYPTSTGDSQIKLQYLEVSNLDQGSYETPIVNHGQYATVGIEDHLAGDGLQYTYNNQYSTAAAPLANMTALTISGAPISTEDPYIVYSGIEIIDENDNEQLDYAEYIEFNLVLNNLGGSSATGVTGEISTGDEYVTLLNTVSAYDDIASGSVQYPLTEFTLQVADICPDNHIVQMNLLVESDQGDVTLPFNLILRAPSIILTGIIVEDGNNAILDPGETAPVLLVFENIGGSTSNALTAEIDFVSDLVFSNSTMDEVGIIEASEQGIAEFEFSADVLTEIGTELIISWQVMDDMGYEFWGETSFFISQVPVFLSEQFDNFPPPGWELEGGFNWLGNFSNAAGGIPPEALFWGGTPAQTTQRLISAPVNTLGSNQLVLEFTQTLFPLGAGFNVGVATTDDGINWNDVVTYDNTDLLNFIDTELLIETPDVGSDQMRFCFYFSGDTQFINYWAIDNIVLNHVPIIPQGFITGNVTLTNGDGNVQEVLISADGYNANPNANGEYVLQLPPGTYDLEVYLPGYLPQLVTDFLVPSAWTTSYQDFQLSEATIDYPPQNLTSEIDVYNINLQWDPPGSVRSSLNKSGKGKTKTRNELEPDNPALILNNRSLQGFNLYRNDELYEVINDISILEFCDAELDNGVYEYYVTAVYEEGETVPSNLETVTIVLPPPDNLTIDSTPTGSNVIIFWDEPNEYVTGYRIYRNDQFLVETVSNYYFDQGVEPAVYTYGITCLYGDYESEPVTGEIDLTSTDDNIIPAVTELSGNYPNPFNPATEIRFQLAEKGHVKLMVYNLKGQQVKVLLDTETAPGIYHVIWDGRDENGLPVSSGIYYYRMTTPQYTAVKKMIMLK